MQVDLNGVVENEDIEQKKRAGKPRKMRLQKCHRLRETFRREPTGFIWQIDQLCGQDRDYLWYRESDHREYDAYNYQNFKERLLCLPAIRRATPVEVRSHDTRQLGINVCQTIKVPPPLCAAPRVIRMDALIREP